MNSYKFVNKGSFFICIKQKVLLLLTVRELHAILATIRNYIEG